MIKLIKKFKNNLIKNNSSLKSKKESKAQEISLGKRNKFPSTETKSTAWRKLKKKLSKKPSKRKEQ